MPFAKYLLLIAAIAFLLHLVWENAQTPLFDGSLSLPRHIRIYTMASLLDALYTVGLYLAIALMERNRRWADDFRLSHLALVFLIGFITATAIEHWAISNRRWSYSSYMPLVPVVGVGLSPVLQLMVLPWATFLLVRRLAKPRR